MLKMYMHVYTYARNDTPQAYKFTALIIIYYYAITGERGDTRPLKFAFR